MIAIAEKTVQRLRVPVQRFTEAILPWQYETFRAKDEGRARFFMCEIHRRGHKTTGGLNMLIRECMRHPNTPYFYMGPTYKQAKKTVWLDPNMLFSYLPDRQLYPWEKNEAELYIKFPNGSILQILGGDDPDSLRGPDWGGGVLDEWALMKENIWTEILNPVMAQHPDRWVMFCYTTKGDNHAAQMFDKDGCIESPAELPACGATSKHKPDWYCTRLDAEVSGIISRVELLKLKERMPTAFYDQEMRCARITVEERALITSRLMASLRSVYRVGKSMRKIISCDPSEGNDEIVLMYFENGKVCDFKALHTPAIADNIMIISGHVKNMAMEYKCFNVIIDSIGCGSGISGDMRLDKRFKVQSFKGNEKSNESERFKDKNTEAVWLTSREMRKGMVDPIEDAETRRQLTKLTCQVNRQGLLQLDEKKLIKKECGCSPDRGKAYVMGRYGIRNVEAEGDEGIDEYGRGDHKEDETAVANSYTVESSF